MPKPTFFNLPDGKRDALVELALREFATHPYHQASLSRIVAQAGIAKGSIYQYFDDKLDLYRWLLTDEVPRRRIAASPLRPGAEPPSDFAELLREMVASGIRFLLDNPMLVGVVAPIGQPTSDPELRALYREVKARGHAQFVALLVGFRDAGQIRDDIDIELVGRVLGIVLGAGIPELVRARTGLGIEELVENPQSTRKLAGAEISKLIDDTIELLLGGIAPLERG